MEPDFFDGTIFSLSFEQLNALIPLLWLCLGVGVTVFAGGFRASNRSLRILIWVTLVPMVVWLLKELGAPAQSIFGTSLEVNSFSRAIGVGVGILALAASLYSKSDDNNLHPEWAALMLSSALGLVLLPCARDWGAFFIYLEMASIPAYVLAAIDTRRTASLEAGLKYLMMGAFSTAIFLMGVALFYGLTGSIDMASLVQISSSLSGPNLAIASVAGILILSGLGFKVALVPFHMWAPDVYQGAPTGLASYLASVTKLSVFAAILVSFEESQLWSLSYVREFGVTLGVLTIVVGSLLAIAQKQLRRMLAYSSIVNAGYIGVSVILGIKVASSLFLYLLVYGLTVIGLFALIENFLRGLGREAHSDMEIADLSVVSARVPKALTILFVLGIFSLSGIPPFPGFFTKYLLLRDLWSAGFRGSCYAIVLGTLLGLAYYLRSFLPLFAEKTGLNSAKREPLAVSALLATCLCALVLGALMFGMNGFLNWSAHVEGWVR